MTPQTSETEQSALDAGTVGFEGELFGGKPNWNRFIKQPLPELNAEEQAFIDGPVEQLCGMLNEWENTHYRATVTDEEIGRASCRERESMAGGDEAEEKQQDDDASKQNNE